MKIMLRSIPAVILALSAAVGCAHPVQDADAEELVASDDEAEVAQPCWIDHLDLSHLTDGLRRRSSIASVPLGTGKFMEVNLVRGRIGTRERVGLFWYEIDGHIVAKGETAKLLTFWHSLRWRRNDGLMIVLLSDQTDPEARQLEGLKELSAQLHAALAR